MIVTPTEVDFLTVRLDSLYIDADVMMDDDNVCGKGELGEAQKNLIFSIFPEALGRVENKSGRSFLIFRRPDQKAFPQCTNHVLQR